MPSRPTRRDVLSGAATGVTLLAAEAMAQSRSVTWSTRSAGWVFTWDIANDRATIQAENSQNTVWAGGLLPALVIANPDKTVTYVKTVVDFRRSSLRASGGELAVIAGSAATGKLRFRTSDYGLEFIDLYLDWISKPLPIVSLYFGTAPLSEDERQAAPTVDQSF